jgi:hypothetical protein
MTHSLMKAPSLPNNAFYTGKKVLPFPFSVTEEQKKSFTRFEFF